MRASGFGPTPVCVDHEVSQSQGLIPRRAREATQGAELTSDWLSAAHADGLMLAASWRPLPPGSRSRRSGPN